MVSDRNFGKEFLIAALGCITCAFAIMFSSFKPNEAPRSWVRINQLGYTIKGIKTAVWVTKENDIPMDFNLIDVQSGKVIFTRRTGKVYGSYGPFSHVLRLNFTAIKKAGTYYIKCGSVESPQFRIADDVYVGTADFGLNYMRQQRSGFNPFLKDSCHTTDGYTMYGPMPDSTRINVWGGWHDATDYLQYVTTSANATYHLLAAYRDFPTVFTDKHLANGLDGKNAMPDIIDEARWGLDWLLKMHPRKDWMFTQLADDRDHFGFRLPNNDVVDYGVGPGKGRPVYFATGKPQGLGKFKNKTTGVASVAGKFTSAFALGAMLYQKKDAAYSGLLQSRSLSAYQLGLAKPGVAQTAPNREPYYYEEDNWTDDMELGAADLYQLTGDKKYRSQSLTYSRQEKVTPWLGADTARHYQWYPFHNFGHYELAKTTDAKSKAQLISYYKQGIDKVWQKAKQNGFYRGVPFIWCSNNLTASFAIQCYLYRKLSNDQQYAELEQACVDWLFGCNPWGKSMVYGLPNDGDTPLHPHSSLNYLNQYPLNGALLDGPVYTSIYKRLKGLKLLLPDKYEEFQSDLAVYHDDAGDYSTNEPTMDGTASLVYLMAAKENEAGAQKAPVKSYGAIIRGDPTTKSIALVFTGDEFADGGSFIAKTLKQQNIRGSFFLTGNFYRNKNFKPIIKQLKTDGNYLGVHSDKHLLYCDWDKRDSLLLTRGQFTTDLTNAYNELKKFNIGKQQAMYFLPPYEWYNDTIARWTNQMGLKLINYTPGSRSNADYTYPEMGNKYTDSQTVYQHLLNYEEGSTNGLNGFMLLIHIGTDPRRTDKFYRYLPKLIKELKGRGYHFVKVNELLKNR